MDGSAETVARGARTIHIATHPAMVPAVPATRHSSQPNARPHSHRHALLLCRLPPRRIGTLTKVAEDVESCLDLVSGGCLVDVGYADVTQQGKIDGTRIGIFLVVAHKLE